MDEQNAPLEDAAFMRTMLNLVIPPDGRMPGAGDLELWATVEASLQRNPAAFATLVAGLEAVRHESLARDPGGLPALSPDDALAAVQSVTERFPALMPALARAVAMAYYQQPAVLIALGEPARPPFPEGFELEPISPEWSGILSQRAQQRPS